MIDPNAQAQPQPQPGQADQQQNQAAPEEQDAYERVVLAGMKILYGDGTHESIMKLLDKNKGNPANAMAEATAMIITQIDHKAAGKVPRQVILQAGIELLAMVGELAEKSNKFEADEGIIKEAGEMVIHKLSKHFGKEQAGQQPPGQEQPGQQPPAQAASPQQQPSRSSGIINNAMGGQI